MELAPGRDYRALSDFLVCDNCRTGGLVFAEVSAEISCQNCGKTFNIVNGVPVFVPEELVNFSEVPFTERDKFLAMKRTAYGEDSFVSRMYNNYHRFAAQKRSEIGEKRLTVDIGFGIGEHYPFIAAKEKIDRSFIGIDLDRFKLEYFTSCHPEVPVLQASAFCLPFAASSVDVVQLLATLEHFSSDEIVSLLDETLRILTPGGSLIVCYPAEGGVLLKLCQVVMHAYLKRKTDFDLDSGAVHRHLTGAEEIRAILGSREELECQETCFYPCGIKSVHFSLFINEIYRKRSR